jgi:hypothetical protein
MNTITGHNAAESARLKQFMNSGNRPLGGGRSARDLDICGSMGTSVSTSNETHHICAANIDRSSLSEIIAT